MNTPRYPCLCCGFKTLAEQPPGTFDICPVCYWQDDNVQCQDPAYPRWANEVSLNEARANFLEYGAVMAKFKGRVRAALAEERD